jgi:hypothetical protein
VSLAEQTDSSPTHEARIERRVRIACILALVALALIAYSLIVPQPLPVIVAMSVAQGIGTLSLLIFLHVVWRDVWQFMGGKKAAEKAKSTSAE